MISYTINRGIDMNILFLCSQNKKRSLTAQRIFNGVNGHVVRSAGTENNARVKLTLGMLGWADVIYCMEKKHVRRVNHKYGDSLGDKEIFCLNIPDDFNYMDDELIEILKSSVFL